MTGVLEKPQQQLLGITGSKFPNQDLHRTGKSVKPPPCLAREDTHKPKQAPCTLCF